MSLSIDTVTIDCADPVRLATFWAAALGYEFDPDSDPDGAGLLDPSDTTRGLFFQPVPEPKTVKNRVHLDVRPSTSMAEEVERLVTLGATIQGEVHVEENYWTVMQDPEGDEFCILRGPKDGWSPSES